MGEIAKALEVALSPLCVYDEELDIFTLTSPSVSYAYCALDTDIARSFNLTYTYTVNDAHTLPPRGGGKLVAQWGDTLQFYQFIVQHNVSWAPTYVLQFHDDTTVTQIATGVLSGFAYNEPQTVRLECIFDTLFPYLNEVEICEGLDLKPYQTVFNNGALYFEATNIDEATFTHVVDAIIMLPNLTITDPIICTESIFAKEYLGINWATIADNPLPLLFEFNSVMPDISNVFLTLGANNDCNIAQLDVINSNHMVSLGVSPYAESNAYLMTFSPSGLALGTSGIERLVVGAGGNVGIGTTDPLYRLQVNGTIKGDRVIGVSYADVTNTPTGVGIEGDTEFVLIEEDMVVEVPLGTLMTTAEIDNPSIGDPSFLKSGTMVARDDYIALANKLGVPKSQTQFMLPYPDTTVNMNTPWEQIINKPDYLVDWNATSGIAHILNKPDLADASQWISSNVYSTTPVSSNIYFAKGNVGIGTATPTAKLQVTGDVQLAGKLTNDTFKYDYTHTWSANTYVQLGQTFTRLYENAWVESCWSPELGKFCTIANFNASWANNLKYLTVAHSSDMELWYGVNPGNTTSWYKVIWVKELMKFVACGFAGSSPVNCIMTSPDASTWTMQATPPFARTTVNGDFGNVYRDIAWAPELPLFVTVGDTYAQKLMTSPNGVNWTLRTAPRVRS